MERYKKGGDSRVGISRRELLYEVRSQKKVVSLRSTFNFVWFENDLFVRNKEQFKQTLQLGKMLYSGKGFSILPGACKIGSFRFHRCLFKAHWKQQASLAKVGHGQKRRLLQETKNIAAGWLQEAKQNGWLPIKNGKYVLTERNIDSFITLLSNGRLRSPINSEVFDTAVKTKVD